MGKASRSKTATKQVNYGKERNWFPWIVTGISIVMVVVITIFVILANQSNKPSEQASIAPQGVVNDGYVVTAAGLDTSVPEQKVETTFEASAYDSEQNSLAIYIDYACSHCADFETNSFEQVERWLEDGTLDSISIHPVNFLTAYSANAANAVACVAQNDPSSLVEAHKVLMDNWDQSLNTKGILDALEEAGVNVTSELESCVRGTTYGDFVQKATERAATGPVPASTIEAISGTPTILLNGTRYPGDPASASDFSEFVLSNLQGDTVEATVTE